MSPKVTRSRVAAPLAPVAVTVNEPPATCGARKAFHVPSSRRCASTTYCTAAPAPSVPATRTETGPVPKPYSAALAGARCSTMSSENPALRLKPAAALAPSGPLAGHGWAAAGRHAAAAAATQSKPRTSGRIPARERRESETARRRGHLPFAAKKID